MKIRCELEYRVTEPINESRVGKSISRPFIIDSQSVGYYAGCKIERRLVIYRVNDEGENAEELNAREWELVEKNEPHSIIFCKFANTQFAYDTKLNKLYIERNWDIV